MIIHPIRILLVDDHPVFRDGLQALFSLREDMQVIAATGTGEEAVRLASEHHPDVVLMDIQMPGVDGIEATRRIITANPAVHVIMLTMVEDDEAVFKAMKAGARGYLHKSASQNEVLGAVETVIGGQAVYSASIARRMMAYFADTKPASVLSASPDLTSVEKEILRLVARGYADEQAAVQLGMDPYDVQIHLTRVIEKLQVSDRAQAVERARQAGLEM